MAASACAAAAPVRRALGYPAGLNEDGGDGLRRGGDRPAGGTGGRWTSRGDENGVTQRPRHSRGEVKKAKLGCRMSALECLQMSDSRRPTGIPNGFKRVSHLTDLPKWLPDVGFSTSGRNS